MSLDKYIEFIKQKHDGQTRKHGTPYYTHPLSVSELLKSKGFSEDYQIAGLFHDLLEDTDTTYDEILDLSNHEIAEAVRLVTKEKGYVMEDYISRIKQNDMAKMVKLADRVHNLSEAHLASPEFQKKYIKETEDWYVDLAKDTVFEDDLKKVLENLKQIVSDEKILKIYNLKDKLEFIEEVASLEKAEWGSNSNKSIAEKVESIKKNFENDFFEKLILVDGNELIGFISIFEYDMEERKDLKPWYATMYVKKEYRGKRIF